MTKFGENGGFKKKKQKKTHINNPKIFKKTKLSEWKSIQFNVSYVLTHSAFI